MPSNIYNFFKNTSWVFRFAFVDTYSLTKSLLHIQEDDNDAYSENFKAFGYENRLFVYNMELPLYFYLLYPVLLLAALLIYFLAKRIKM